MTKAVIVGYVRTPFTQAVPPGSPKHAMGARGKLASARPEDLLASAMKGLIEKTGVNASDVEDVMVGCAIPEAEQGMNIARIAAQWAGIPKEAGAATLNRFCGSSMEAIHSAAGKIAMGAGDVFICAGVESMSVIPSLSGGHNPLPHPEIAKERPELYIGMPETADNVAEKYGVTRDLQEEFAAASHQKASKAQKENAFKDEIVAITTHPEVTEDDGIRHDATAEGMQKLKPVRGAANNASVTAATSSQITDGASAVMVVSEDYAKKHNLPVLAEIESIAVTGCDASIMGIGPIGAVKKALERAGLSIEDIDVVELNEAFASQALASMKELNIPAEKVNLHGGAIALGHPLGASGARITGKAAKLLSEKKGAKRALSTMCIGGGQGIATILKKPTP